MSVIGGNGKPLFGPGQFGQSQQNNNLLAQAKMHQYNHNNHIQGITSGMAIQMMNQNSGITNTVSGFNDVPDYWVYSKYSKDEFEMAIGQKCKFRNNGFDQEGFILEVDPVKSYFRAQVNVSVDATIFVRHPEEIVEIPCIDKLRQSKLYKIVK